MKRTFGRFMSLLLVLAMVLAMVPAALAANQAYSVEPDSTIKIKTSIIKEGSVSWSSSDTSVATVSGSTTEATVAGVKASNTAVRITATGKVNGRDYSEYFTVYVRDAYTLTLALSNSNINSTVALNQGNTRTLTATVTVGTSSGVTAGNLANCEVHFTSDNPSVISVSPASKTVTASTVGNYTTYKVEATVTAAGVGGATLTAQVYYKSKDGMKPSTSAAATKQIGFRVSGAATVTVTLPDAQQTLSLEANGTRGLLQPKVSGYSGTAQPKLLYLYDTTNNNLYVRPNTATTSATVEPYKACQPTKIYICLADYNPGLTYANIDQSNPSASIVGSYAVCTVSIRNKDMSVTSMEVINNESVTYNGKTVRLQTQLDNGTMVFGLQDNYYTPAVKSTLIRGALMLTARIKAPDTLLASAADLENAYSRIEWTSSAPAIAKVDSTRSDSTSATAVIKPVTAGTATITAKVDDNVTATYTVTVYQGRSYRIVMEPSIGEMVSKMTDAELAALFEMESAVVEFQSSIYSDETMTCYLPVKSAAVVTGPNGGKRFQYTLDGLKTATKEFSYSRNDPDGAGVTTSKDVTFSDITFMEQPANANYKLTDTFADLAMSASVSSGKNITSVVWYMNSDQKTGSADKAILTEIVSGSCTGYRSVLSDLKQYISGTGTYVFYCRVTTSDGKFADSRKAIISVNGENYIAITISPTSVRAGETFTITGVPQDYVSGKLVDVTSKSYTIAWSSSDENIVKLSSKTTTNSSPAITAMANAGGQVTIKAETTIGSKKYAAEMTIFVAKQEQSSASVTVVPVCGKAGETVRVPVILEKNPGFADLSIEIDYDSSVVALTDVQPNKEVGSTFTSSQSYAVKPYMLNWINGEGNNTFNGVLAVLTFTIKQDAPLGSYPITVDYYHGITGDKVDGEDVNYNKDWKRVPLNYRSGKLIVCAYTPGDINGDGEVDITDAVCLLQYVAGWKLNNVVKEALDVNGDGRINTKDAIQILRYIAGWTVTLY